jgi:hypothetical protein
MWKIALTAVLIAFAGSSASAQLGTGDLFGRWCGASTNKFVTNLHFEPDQFSVTWRDTNERKVHRVLRYELHGSQIRVIWINGSTETWTEYGDFRGNTMHQMPNGGAPLYVFTRC